ncbi:MAG TPA: hypothetical protein VGD71_07105 [Kribbella sp.]|jgi:hypothetical protein
MAERGGPVIRLQDGPGAGWQFYEEDFLERIRAAQRNEVKSRPAAVSSRVPRSLLTSMTGSMFMDAPVSLRTVEVCLDGAGLAVLGVAGAGVPPGDPLTVTAPSSPD